jgi:actin-related protein 5
MDMEVDEDTVTLHPIQTEKQFTPTPDYSDYQDSFASTGTALVIDNGKAARFVSLMGNLTMLHEGV